MAAFADAARKQVKGVLYVELVLCAVGTILIDPVTGVVCVAVSGCTFLYYRLMAFRQFGGITGDLAGYFLQLCELFWLLAVVVTGRIMVL